MRLLTFFYFTSKVLPQLVMFVWPHPNKVYLTFFTIFFGIFPHVMAFLSQLSIAQPTC